MELNTSHYFPLDIENLVTVLSFIDKDQFNIKAGIILQVTQK